MTYTEVIRKHVGSIGYIERDENITFSIRRQTDSQSKLLEVGEDFVLLRYLNTRGLRNEDEEIYVHISRFILNIEH